jgi:heme oxygenase
MDPTHTISVTPDNDSTHARLRRATVEQHRRLDRGLGYLLSDQLSLPRYVDLLAALFGFYAPLEEGLSRCQGASPSFRLPIVFRADLLQRDLRAFGRPTEHLPRPTGVPAITTIDRAAGVIYVLEGASLGGQVIARGLSRCLGIGPENGAAFFTGRGAHTAARWKQVVAWLEERGRDARGGAEVVAAACETFGALSSWLLNRKVLDE